GRIDPRRDAASRQHEFARAFLARSCRVYRYVVHGGSDASLRAGCGASTRQDQENRQPARSGIGSHWLELIDKARVWLINGYGSALNAAFVPLWHKAANTL